MRDSRGKVYLTGAGPGDPELLTRRALRVLEQADVVLYDRLVSLEILALARPGALLVDAGKQHGESDEAQQRVMDDMLCHARKGKTVVRLKGGDPFVFGRGGEEQLHLERHGIEVEVIPGVSSALAAPAAAGIPLTLRGAADSFAVVTGHGRCGPTTDWERFAAVDTLVVLMGVAERRGIARSLISAGRPSDEPAAFIENATTARQRTIETTLGRIAAGEVHVEAPAVLVIGEVCAARTPSRLAAGVAFAARS